MKTPESMTDYLKLTNAQKMELSGIPSVRSDPLLSAALADGWRFEWDLRHRAIWIKLPDRVSSLERVDALGLSITRALNSAGCLNEKTEDK